jgi:hypothetical protein
MNIPSPNVSDAERDRQERLTEQLADEGPGWEERFKPGTFGCHELLDRTSRAAEAVARDLLEHPACFRDPEWYALADQAAEALNQLYQKIGAAHLAAEDNP